MFKDEDGNIYTETELETYFEQNQEEIYLNSGAETFAEYLSNCLSKNGSLTQDFYEDLRMEWEATI